jgi:serine/threonine protein kinase
VLQTGAIPPAAAVLGWKSITHLDIGLRNLFLEPDPEGGPPNVVLSDYGISIYDLDHDPNTALHANPDEYVINTVNLKFPPEFQKVRRAPDGTAVQIGEKSDVWEIGSLMWKLLSNLNQDEPRRDLQKEDGTWRSPYLGAIDNGIMGEPDTDPPFGHTFPAFKRYSLGILTLMAKCLNWEPINRPSFVELRQEIRQFLDAHPDVRDNTSFDGFKMTELEHGLRLNDAFSEVRRKARPKSKA